MNLEKIKSIVLNRDKKTYIVSIVIIIVLIGGFIFINHSNTQKSLIAHNWEITTSGDTSVVDCSFTQDQMLLSEGGYKERYSYSIDKNTILINMDNDNSNAKYDIEKYKNGYSFKPANSVAKNDGEITLLPSK